MVNVLMQRVSAWRHRQGFERTALALVAGVFAALVGQSAVAAPYATDWVSGHNSKARLLVGGAPKTDGSMQRFAAIEIVMPKEWKTYWRHPGSAGGIPPQLNFSGSKNVAATRIGYPAPVRMVDATGAAIGYKGRVVFPIEIDVVKADAPVVLNVAAFFGVCREICIPAQAAFKVTLPQQIFRQTPPELIAALAQLPTRAGKEGSASNEGKPQLGSVKAARTSEGHRGLRFDVLFGAGVSGGDLFIESGDGRGLDMSRVVSRSGKGRVTFEVPVRDDETWKALGGHGLILTMVSDRGAVEQRIALPAS